jgi:LytS/YehU family sensor histidine kinase
VYETATGLVTVRQELEFIRNYAELQLLRFDQGELDFQLNISGTYDEQEIEPGIFIPFIENAFKYGAEPEKQSFIALSVDITAPDKVTFSVENTVFPALQNDTGSQKGIATTKKRLKLSYPGRHQLKIEGGQIFRVVLTLVTQ